MVQKVQRGKSGRNAARAEKVDEGSPAAPKQLSAATSAIEFALKRREDAQYKVSPPD